MTRVEIKSIIKGLVIALSIPLVAFIILGLSALFVISSALGTFSSKNELVDNYELNTEHILKLKDCFEKMVPEDFFVSIEYEEDNNIGLWVGEKSTTSSKQFTCLFKAREMNPFDYEIEPLTAFDSIYFPRQTDDLEVVKKKLNWTDSTFIEISQLLKNANCISIESSMPVIIGFARSGLGKYNYYLFNDSIHENEIHEWNDSCSYIYYNPKLVLNYQGGAFGRQSFPDPDLRNNAQYRECYKGL